MDSSQLEMVNSPASTARPVGPGPVGGRCDACKKGHNKCDGATPGEWDAIAIAMRSFALATWIGILMRVSIYLVCGMCAKRGRECSYSRAAAAAAAGVVRSTPSSARRGSGVNATAPGSACLPCRKGKRKCDQERPSKRPIQEATGIVELTGVDCGPCTKRQIECVYGSTLKRPRYVGLNSICRTRASVSDGLDQKWPDLWQQHRPALFSRRRRLWSRAKVRPVIS